MSNQKTLWFYGLLIVVASMAIGMVIASRLELASTSSAQTTMQMPPMNSAPISGPIDSLTFRQIAQAQTPTVVNIRTESRRRTQELTDFFGGDDFLRRFFGPEGGRGGQGGNGRPRDQITQGAGSGFIIDDAGLIVTNNHVVEGATKIEIGFFGDEAGNYYDARVVGRDPLTDSALLELVEKPSMSLPEARFGDSTKVQPGDWVMAIGNPFNYAHTVTVGVISATERAFPVAEGRTQAVLQTDAAINPGNSGGPLLNLRGEVIGVNTAILANERASNLGIGFAVPINAIRELLPQLREGRVTRGRIGVEIGPIPAEAVSAFGLKDRKGAVVASVDPNGPAGRAGMRPGDVVTQYNGKDVTSSDELVRMVVTTKPGTTVPVRVIRDKQAQTVNVTVEQLDLEQETRDQADAAGDASEGFGMTLDTLTPDLARRLRMPGGASGAVITDLDPSGAAARVGITPGDVILEVNRRPVRSAADAVRELQRVQAGQPAFLLLWRGGKEVFVTITKSER
jgi:serine protease Do